MNRATPFLLTALFSACLLSACGSTSVPAAQTVAAPVQSVAQSAPALPTPAQPAAAELMSGVSVTAAVLGSAGAATSASLHLGTSGSSLSAQSVSVSVDSLPSGVSLQVLPSSSDASGLTVPLSVQGSSSAAQGDAWLKVHLNGQTQLVRVPVLRASSSALPTVGGAPFKVAASVPCGPDMLLSAPVTAPLEQRSVLVRYSPAGHTFSTLPLGLTGTEGVTSQLCAPDGTVWLTLRSDDAVGSVVARLNPDTGKLDRFPVGAVADTLNNLTRTADGRLWFVQYKHDRLGEFDPLTGTVVSHAVSENAENLRLGQDGALYYSQFYSAPAVVRYDPATAASRALSVGNSSKNLPRASVQVGGAVWYVDAWMQTLNRLDLTTGAITQARLPAGATPGELVADTTGTLWVADAASHVLYRLVSGSLDAVTVPLTAADGPRALSVGTDGQLWYESAGQLVGQQ